MISRVLAVSCCLSMGCASVFPARVAEANKPFVPTGEVKRYGGAATFDAVRVRGPGVEMTKRTDGSWGGRLQAWEFEVSVNGKTISGVELQNRRAVTQGQFTMANSGDEQDVVVDGIIDHYQYHFEVHPDRVVLGKGPQQRVLGRNPDGTYGPEHNVVMSGDAGGGLPPWPQIAFAMIGTEPALTFFHDFRQHRPTGDTKAPVPTANDYPPAL